MYRSENRRDFILASIIFALALGVRVINLGQFLTTDEPRGWLGWAIEFMQALIQGNLAETYQHYSPGVTLMWSGGIGLYLNYLFGTHTAASFSEFLQTLPFDPIEPDLIFWFRLPNVIIGAACIAIAYPLAKRLLGGRIAFVGCLLLTLDPLYIGMNRILGHDGLAASLMLVSTLGAMVFFLRDRGLTVESTLSPPPQPSPSEGEGATPLSNAKFAQGEEAGGEGESHNVEPRLSLHGKSFFVLILSATAAGLAILAKSTAYFLLPFVGLVALIAIIQNTRRLRSIIRDALIWGAIVTVTIFIFWPALWVDAAGTLSEMIEGLRGAATEPHNRGSFFAGQPVPDPGIAFYWVAAYFRITVVTTIGLALSVLYLLLSRQTANNRSTYLLLFGFIVLYLVFLTFGSKKQDRYIVPILPAATFLAAAGYVWLAENLRPRIWGAITLIVVILLQAAVALQSAPHYLTHYNWLAGGSRYADRMLLVGWGEGLELAADYLNALPNAESLRVASWYHSAFEPYFHGQAIESAGGEKISRSAKPALSADYAVLYVNQIQRQMPTPGLIQYFQSEPPERIIRVDGIDYAYIYAAPAMAHALSGEVRLVGQAELLGYDLLDGQGEPAASLSANDSALVKLYWAWQGKSPDEPIVLNLEDETGQMWGWGHPLGTEARLPFEDWQEGMIAVDGFALSIFPGTPPGEYVLKAWIHRPATGETVGVFPLNHEDVRLKVDRPETPPRMADLALSQEIIETAAPGVTLLGSTGIEAMTSPWQPGESRELALYWRADQSLSDAVWLTMALTNEDGINHVEWRSMPATNRFPTDQWQPNDIIRDPWSLTLPPTVPPGKYDLTIRFGEAAPFTLTQLTVEGRPRNFDLPTLDLSFDAEVQFGNGIRLAGIQGLVDDNALLATPGQSLDLAIIWQGISPVDTDYTITVQLLDGNNQVLAQRDGVPLDGSAPTTSWTNGEVIADSISLAVPADVGAPPHRLLIALYRPNIGERLLLSDGGDHVEITVALNR